MKVNLLDKKLQDCGLTLIIVFSIENEPFLLLTNRKIENAHQAKKIASDYLKRWRIEEYFKFKKQEFDLEDMRIRSYNGIKLMNQLVSMVISFLNYELLNKKQIIKISNPIKENTYFEYYRILWGIREILKQLPSSEEEYINYKIRNINYILRNQQKQITIFNYLKTV